jgi:L-2-hydroxycarboxylate dehydrogenase (NAD+)
VVGLIAGTLNGAAMGREVIDFNADSTSPTNTGHAIVMIDVSAFGEVAEFKAAVDTLIRDLRASEKMPGVDRILMPGEQSHERIAANRRDGIPVAANLMGALDRLAEDLDIAPLRTR